MIRPMNINDSSLDGMSIDEASLYLTLVRIGHVTAGRPIRYSYETAVSEFGLEVDELVMLLKNLHKKGYIEFQSSGAVFDVSIKHSKGVLSSEEVK